MPTQFKFQTHTSGISIPFTGLVFLLTLAGLSGSQLAAVQIVSPSTNTLPEGARIAEETAPIEPSRPSTSSSPSTVSGLPAGCRCCGTGPASASSR